MSKFGKKLKKGLTAPIKIAHKVTHNKTIENLHKRVQKMVPKPFDVFVKVGAMSSGLIHKGLKATVLKKQRSKAARVLKQAASGVRGPAVAKKAMATMAIIDKFRQAQAGDMGPIHGLMEAAAASGAGDEGMFTVTTPGGMVHEISSAELI